MYKNQEEIDRPFYGSQFSLLMSWLAPLIFILTKNKKKFKSKLNFRVEFCCGTDYNFAEFRRGIKHAGSFCQRFDRKFEQPSDEFDIIN